MPKGWPDFTVPITIEAVTVETLPIDIVAQTVGNIAIDIAAQTVGNIAVNIAAIGDVTMNVNIAASVATLRVNLAVGGSSVRHGGGIKNPSFEEDFEGWWRYGDAEIDTFFKYSGGKSCKFPAGKDIDLKQGPLDPPIPTDLIGKFTLMWRVGDVGDGLGVTLYYEDGTYEDTVIFNTVVGEWQAHNVDYTAGKYIIQIEMWYDGTRVSDRYLDDFLVFLKPEMQADIISSVQIDMNIAAQTVTLNIKTAVDEHVDTDIVSSVTLNVDIVAQTVGNIAIDIAAQTVGNINVNIAAQAANVNVDIKAQTVDLNIKTSGGVNLVIDKLTQAAYTERRSTLANDNGVTTPTAPPSNLTATTYKGKFFPRGMRGHLRNLQIYCKRLAVGTLTLAYSPHPSMGEIGTVTITPGMSWDWKVAYPRRFWNYDSLFIWVKACSEDVSYGYDETEPYDAYGSADDGVTWVAESFRYFIRTFITGETVGDLPVSGTLNTIEIPHTSSGENTTGLVSLPNAAETTLMTVPGAGHMDWFSVQVSHSDIELKVYCDGILAFWDNAASMNAKGIAATTPGVQLPVYNVGAGCVIASTLRFEFTRELKFACRNDTGAEKNATVYNTLITMLK